MVLMNSYSRVRVGVAGATGYAGVELLRRLASTRTWTSAWPWASSASEPRRVPALKRIWDASGRAASTSTGWPTDTDAVFLAVPDTLAAEVAPALAQRAARVSSICPARSGCATRPAPALVSAFAGPRPAGHVRPDRALSRGARRGARWSPCAGCYPTAAILALQPLVAAGLLEPGDHHRREVGHLGRRQDADRAHALLRVSTAASSAYGVFAHRHGAEIEQELGMPVTFVPHLVPLDRGILETIYARLRPGVDAAAIERDARRRLRGLAVRAADRRRPARDQARRAHELLRHRLARRPAGRQLVMVVVHRQPGEGRGRPGDPELQRRVRLRRNDWGSN